MRAPAPPRKSACGSPLRVASFEAPLFDSDNRLLAIDTVQDQLIEIDPQTGDLIGLPILPDPRWGQVQRGYHQ